MGARAEPARHASRAGLPARVHTDRRLAELVARGDDQAFATLYARHQRKLYGYCRAITRQEQDAQDALQGAMMSALSALRKGVPDAPLRPWLFRIVHNEAVDILRARRPNQPLDGAREIAAVPVDGALEARRRLAILVEDLGDLPERQRSALVMRELSGLSHREIGVALEVGEAGAKQAILDARVSLAEFEKGRAMHCRDVQPLISHGDGRKLRGRPVRAHLRACADCRALRDAIHRRQADLRAIAPPLAPVAAAALLGKILGGGGGAGGAGGVGIVSAKAAMSAVAAKAVAGTAIVAAVGVGTAETVNVIKDDKPKAAISVPAAGGGAGTAASSTAGSAGSATIPAANGRAQGSAGDASASGVRGAGAGAPDTPGERRNEIATERSNSHAGTPPGKDNPHRGGALAPGRAKNKGKGHGRGGTPVKGPKKARPVRPARPVKPAKPVRTPAPNAAPQAVPTPKPVKTPRPVPTANPVNTPAPAPTTAPTVPPTPAPTVAPAAPGNGNSDGSANGQGANGAGNGSN